MLSIVWVTSRGLSASSLDGTGCWIPRIDIPLRHFSTARIERTGQIVVAMCDGPPSAHTRGIHVLPDMSVISCGHIGMLPLNSNLHVDYLNGRYTTMVETPSCRDLEKISIFGVVPMDDGLHLIGDADARAGDYIVHRMWSMDAICNDFESTMMHENVIYAFSSARNALLTRDIRTNDVHVTKFVGKCHLSIFTPERMLVRCDFGSTILTDLRNWGDYDLQMPDVPWDDIRYARFGII